MEKESQACGSVKENKCPFQEFLSVTVLSVVLYSLDFAITKELGHTKVKRST